MLKLISNKQNPVHAIAITTYVNNSYKYPLKKVKNMELRKYACPSDMGKFNLNIQMAKVLSVSLRMRG
jgi:hypothetical protein